MALDVQVRTIGSDLTQTQVGDRLGASCSMRTTVGCSVRDIRTHTVAS
jgi:hypothetical protein